MPSLYSTPPNQDVSSTNSTSLYGGAGTPIPDSSGNLIVRGDLTVLSGNILTTATTGNIFPTNATTINIGNAATAINIGANTGTTTVNNDLVVNGDLTINGTFIAPDAEFGNITIAVATDNTITTTTGALILESATGEIDTGSSTAFTTNSSTFNLLNFPTTVNAFLNATSLFLGENGVGTTDIRNDLLVRGDVRINGNDIKSSSGTTAITLSGANVTVAGTVTATGADLGNITVAVADDNTITTTSGDLNLTAVAGSAVNIVSETTAPTSITRNTNSTATSIRSLSLAVESAGTPAVGFGNTLEWQVEAQPGNTERGGFIAVDLTDITPGSEDFVMKFGLMENGAAYTTKMSLDSTGSLDIDNDLTVGGTTIGLAQDTTFEYSENNDRLNRPTVKSTTGNQSGLRIEAPNATASAIAVSSVFNTNDPDNGKFINIRADGSATPISIRTGEYTAGVFGASGDSIQFIDGSTTYATVNPAGPTIGTDLATKTYVDAVAGATYTIDASSTTGGANFNLVGSNSTTDTIKFASGTGVTVSRTSASEIGVAIGQPVATTDAVTFASVAANGVNVGLTANTISGNPLAFASNTAGGGSITATATDSVPGGGTGQLTVNTSVLSYTHTDGALVPGVTGTWSFNPSGTTSFPSYTFPYADGTANQLLKTDGSGNLSWFTPTDLNTTYTIDASSTTGGANLNLVGSDSTTDTVKIASGTGVTVAQVNANELSVAIGQAVGTGDSPSFAGVTGGNITVGVSTDNTITTTDTNGDLTVTPNGTGKLVVTTETDTNITDGNYILGNISATRNTAWTAPVSGLSTISSTNGVSAASSTGYGAGFQAVYYSGDTTAGTNSSAGYTGRGASGTNSVPGAAANNQVLVTINADGYATTGFAQNIATVNSGGGTAAISPAQIQLYARQAFADDGTTVTAAGVGFRVRGFPTSVSMSTANRVNYIDHSPNAATYRSDTFTFQQGTTTTSTANLRSNTWNIQNSAGTTTYAQFASSGATIGGVDSPSVLTRVRGASAGTSPSLTLRNSNTVAATPATGDGTSFRMSTAGSNGTQYQLAEISAQYSTTGDDAVLIGIANGDQTGATFSNLATINTRISSTVISAGTPSATPGASTVTPVATFSSSAATFAKPVGISGSTSGTVTLSAGVAPNNQTYTLPAAYPTANNQVLVSTTGGTTSWVSTNSLAANYLDANWTTAIGTLTANTIYGIPLTSLSATNITIATGAIAIDNATATGPTRITFSQTGRYNLQFSIQLANSYNAEEDFDLWLRKNTVDVADSNTQITVNRQQSGNPGKNIMALNLLLNVTSVGDYYELVYATTNAGCKPEVIAAITTPYTRPRAPAIIVTVVPVGA